MAWQPPVSIQHAPVTSVSPPAFAEMDERDGQYDICLQECALLFNVPKLKKYYNFSEDACCTGTKMCLYMKNPLVVLLRDSHASLKVPLSFFIEIFRPGSVLKIRFSTLKSMKLDLTDIGRE
jgi:hypothetical protein